MTVDMQELMLGELRCLRTVYRYGKLRTMIRESTIEHIGWHAIYTYIYAKDLERRYGGYRFDMGIVMAKSVFHDLDEALTADMLRTFKHHDEKLWAEIRRVTRQLMKAFIPKIEHTLWGIWSEAKSDDLTGELIEFVDIFVCVIYFLEGWLTGNWFMRDRLAESGAFLLKAKLEQKNRPAGIYLSEIASCVNSTVRESIGIEDYDWIAEAQKVEL